jgi:DNA polymerase-3 subunit beta
MKAECQIEKIKKALVDADKITGKNLTLPILSSILIIATERSLKFRATNINLGIEIEIPAKVEKQGVIAVHGSTVATLFSSLNDQGNVFIEQNDQSLNISTKHSSFVIKSYSHEDFPTIPVIEGETIKISVKKFIEGIKSVYYSSSLSDIKPEIASIYIYSDNDSLVYVATDSFRLAEKKIKYKSDSEFPGILIPYKNIIEIIKIIGDLDGDISLIVNKNQISFNAPGIYLTSRAVDGVFPDYKQIIPKEFKSEAVVLKQNLLNSLKTSTIFSDKFNQITLTLKPGQKILEINSKNADVGEYKTKIEGSFSGEDIEMSFNSKYVIDCFQSISNDSIVLKFNNTNKPMIIQSAQDTSFTYLVMPMNR